MTQRSEYHGGLVFPGDAQNALADCSGIVMETLEDYGHPVEHAVPLSAASEDLHTAGCCVRLELSALPDGSPGAAAGAARLTVSLTPSFAGHDTRETNELLLAVILFRLVQHLDATRISWLDFPGMLTRDQFLGAFSGAAPQPVRPNRPHRGFQPVDDELDSISRRCDTIMGRPAHGGISGLVEMTEEERLALAFREDPHPDEVVPGEEAQESSQLRLASWAMTGMVASVSAPVALSLAAVNLVRGENFRLNTQVLSLSAFVAFMHSSGAASAMVSVIG